MTNGDYFWAKTVKDVQGNSVPGINVRDHCVIVGCVADTLLGMHFGPLCKAVNEGSGESFVSYRIRSLAVWLAACHDIGKISPGFLQKCDAWLKHYHLETEVRTKAWTQAESDHSKVSQFTLQYFLRGQFGFEEEEAAFWAAAAGMHHGGPHWNGEWKRAAPGIATNDIWESRRRDLAEELSRLFGAPECPPGLKLDDLSSLWWTAGLISVADWIGSDENFFSSDRNDTLMNLADIQAASRNATSQIGLDAPAFTAGLSFFDLFGFPPNDLQTAALKVIREPGVYVIEAPMGIGKTEAALAVAYQLISNGHAGGLYFALPTQATSNRIHERVATFLYRVQTVAPRLIHSGSWLVDKEILFPSIHAERTDDQRSVACDWFASSKRALLAPFGVGTVDQALLGVIAVKHFFVRHFALAGKVVVLDEVHSYDVFTGTLIEALVSALVKLRCTVIILSATLTRERREKLLSMAGPRGMIPEPLTIVTMPSAVDEPFPLITGVAGGKSISPCPIPPPQPKPPVAIRFRPETDILTEAVEAARSGACVLWICNTVDRALATYRNLCGERRDGDPPIGLLHSRFPFNRRQELESDWMSKFGKDLTHRPSGCLLVSTQIVEQSVDLDADLLITELAPPTCFFNGLGVFGGITEKVINPVLDQGPKSGSLKKRRRSTFFATPRTRNPSSMTSARKPKFMRPTCCFAHWSNGAKRPMSTCPAIFARGLKPPTNRVPRTTRPDGRS